MLQYINQVPNKIDYYELIKTEYDDIEVSELGAELQCTIACVSVYNGERLVGMGRVKQEGSYLCIEDLIVKLEPCKEEIQSNIIINLFNQINQMKCYDMTVRDCLSMKKSNEEIIFRNQDKQGQIGINIDSTANGYVGV